MKSRYLEGILAEFQLELVRGGHGGLRKLAYSAISQRLVPFEHLRAYSAKDIAKLLNASDPFTLVFGFELCRDRLAQGSRAFEALGEKFLQRLFSNEAWLKQRCEVFAACVVVTTVHLRPSANATEVPLYWFRLAVFAHASFLANALRALPKTESFFKWAVDNFGGSYTWHTAVDMCEEPRWEADWIDPNALRSELIGRCANALWTLPEAKRPKLWTTLVLKALGTVTPDGQPFSPARLTDSLPRVFPRRARQSAKERRRCLRSESLSSRPQG